MSAQPQEQQDDAEFERIRAAIEDCADVLEAAIVKHGNSEWDYLVIAVPTRRTSTRIGMMSSVMPEALPQFLKFVVAAFGASAAAGRLLDDRTPQGEPS